MLEKANDNNATEPINPRAAATIIEEGNETPDHEEKTSEGRITCTIKGWNQSALIGSYPQKSERKTGGTLSSTAPTDSFSANNGEDTSNGKQEAMEERKDMSTSIPNWAAKIEDEDTRKGFKIATENGTMKVE